jgi:cyclopropane fatty-acyl-phospholipid synthase-like methyltransferase
MAEHYLSTREVNNPLTLAALEQFASNLPRGSAVLDLGCGAGVPVTQWLAQRFVVTGVDISARQLQLAREHVPGATLIKASMTEVDFPPEAFDAVVALYSIIHVPRTEQPMLVRRIHRWLKPAGGFFATWAVHAWEGAEENWEGWGAPMWWSHHDQETNLLMLQEAGFRIESADIRTSDGETWLWVIARKQGASTDT